MIAKVKQNNSIEDFLREAIPIINNESERIWYKVVDVTVFEQRCFNNLSYTFKKLGSDIESRQALINRVVKRTAAYCVKRSKIENVSSLEFLAEPNDKKHFEPVDVLADIESEVLAKEKVANLAESNLRKKIVLDSWKDGCINDYEIARLLADKLGGTFYGHLSFLVRFREKCKQALAGVA